MLQSLFLRAFTVWILMSLLLAGSSCHRDGGKETEKDDSVPVELAAVVDTSISSYIAAAGNLEPEKSAQVLAKVEGTVVAVEAEEGDTVQEGQILARLDGSELHLSREQARIRAEAEEVEYERSKSLYAKGLLSERDFAQRKNSFELAKSELESAALRYSYTTIRAPFSGRVTHREIDAGQTVAIGTPLFTVEDTTPLLCKVHLPGHLIPSIDVGQPADILIGSSPDSTLLGRVRMISPVVDPATGTVKVTVELDQGNSGVRPGTFVDIRMTADTHDDVPAIPRKALLSEAGELYVFAAGSDTVRRIKVTTGYQMDDLVEVTSGVCPGDSVVVVGHGGIEEGTKIRVVSAPGSTATTPDTAQVDTLSVSEDVHLEGGEPDSSSAAGGSNADDDQGDVQ